MRAVKQPLLCRAPHAAPSRVTSPLPTPTRSLTRQLGPLGALGYRVINTLDSRVGYHGKYEWLGKPSARLDDLTNLAPARLTALALTAAALVTPECDAARGIRAAWRDCSLCASPNAGWPMGAMAGLLGVRLEKKGHYTPSEMRPGRSGRALSTLVTASHS